MYFLFDENVPYKFVQGLSLIEEANNKSTVKATVTHPRLLGKAGAPDQEIIRIAGSNNGIIISFDKDFKHVKSYYPLYKQYQVGIVFLKLTKAESNYWGIVKLVINKWEELKLLLKEKSRPFVYEISKRGIQRFEC